MSSKQIRFWTMIATLETFAVFMGLASGMIEGDLPYYVLIVSTLVSVGSWLFWIKKKGSEEAKEGDKETLV